MPLCILLVYHLDSLAYVPTRLDPCDTLGHRVHQVLPATRRVVFAFGAGHVCKFLLSAVLDSRGLTLPMFGEEMYRLHICVLQLSTTVWY